MCCNECALQSLIGLNNAADEIAAGYKAAVGNHVDEIEKEGAAYGAAADALLNRYMRNTAPHREVINAADKRRRAMLKYAEAVYNSILNAKCVHEIPEKEAPLFSFNDTPTVTTAHIRAKSPDMDHSCIGNGCRWAGCKNRM